MDIPFGSNLADANVQAAMQGIAQMQGQFPAQMTLVKNALNGGELSPDMQARYDLPRYQLGCEKLLNMIPLPGGGLTKRPGLAKVGNAGKEEAGAPDIVGRLYPFVYSATVQFMLLFMAVKDGATPTMIYYMHRNGKTAPVESGCTLPYKGDEIFAVSCCQVGKFIYMAHPKYPPAKVVIEITNSGGPFALDIPVFKYEKIGFAQKGPSNGFISIGTVGYPTPGVGGVRNYYLVTGVDDETGEEYLPCQVPGDAQYVPPTSSGYHWVLKIGKTPGCSEHRIYKLRGGEYGFIGRITDGGDEFHDFNYSPDTEDPPPTKQDFFQGEGNYPSIVFMHQQRLGFAATLNDPMTIWFSQSNVFECFNYKTPPHDDDGIEATLASSKANQILWAVSDRTGLAIGTSGEEWYLTGGEGGAITPNSLSFQPQTAYGTEPGLDPVRANAGLLFVQRGGKSVRDLGFSYQADRYEAQDLTLMARHVFRYTKIADWCWQGSPANILWCVLANGKLAGLTYMPEHEIAAWHRHETAGDFLSCATLDDTDGRSRLWTVVRRNVPQPDGTSIRAHYIEILEPYFEGLPEAWDNYPITVTSPRHVDGEMRQSFKARCVPCLPEQGMENGASTLRVKKINAIKCRVINSSPFQCRVFSQNADDTPVFTVPIQSAGTNTSLARQGYATQADWQCPIGAGFRDGAKLELIFDGPDPATVLGIAVTMEISREAGGQV